MTHYERGLLVQLAGIRSALFQVELCHAVGKYLRRHSTFSAQHRYERYRGNAIVKALVGTRG